MSYVEVEYEMSERHACRLLGMGRSSYRYRGRKAERDTSLRARLKELAARRHLSRKLCLRDSRSGLESALKQGIELVKHGSDVSGQAFPLSLLQGRNGKAEFEL